ncbi:Cuticle protein 19 [Eumeta japonica]|uniref:Cuticle protein 19 n=1 Tax=Eumeta variegata TaxID=151549 RepID=A0A4C1TIK2_EUMVA|nr:Cuticle protein 19 [Eumeta japonica]
MFQIICLLALTSCSRAGDPLDGLVYAPAHASLDYYAHPGYAFDYAVNDPVTGDKKAQWEKRDGDVVRGAYSLVEPDGSLRIVEYWADDKSGFNAVVKRIGPSHHPGAPTAHRAPIRLLPSFRPIGPISVGHVAEIDRLATAPIHTKPIVHSVVYPTVNLLHAQPVLHAPAPIIKSAPILAPNTALIASSAHVPAHDGVVRAQLKYLPIDHYRGRLNYIDVKEPHLSAWSAPNAFSKYTH